MLLSQASGNLRDLIEGNKIRGIPAPPSQILGTNDVSSNTVMQKLSSSHETDLGLGMGGFTLVVYRQQNSGKRMNDLHACLICQYCFGQV